MKDFYPETYGKICVKLRATCERIGSMIPYIPENGRYKDLSTGDGIFWWTNGFWPGMLWQMYKATGEEPFKRAAEGVEVRFDEALEGFLGLHHDVGFMWLHTAVANYRLTGNADSRRRGLHAATILAGRYNPAGKFIRAWNVNSQGNCEGWMIVDSMMNIPLLHWASDETNDPRFSYIANSHADTCLATILRPDGSCNHIVSLDPRTGEFLDNPGGQGYASGSSWTRGNAWALYGFALNYCYTKEQKYLDAAKRIAHYFIANLAQQDWLPVVDFRSPAEPLRYDSTAGAIAACGMQEIAEHVPEYEKNLYLDSALRTLWALDKKFCDYDKESDGILGGGTAAYHGSVDKNRDVKIIYGDYFFTEAVLRGIGKGFRIW